MIPIKAFKTFFSELVLGCLQTQGEASFCREIWSLKASVGRIESCACACLCKFSARLVHAYSFADFSVLTFLSFSLISIMSTGKEQIIISGIYLFSAVLNIYKVCH